MTTENINVGDKVLHQGRETEVVASSSLVIIILLEGMTTLYAKGYCDPELFKITNIPWISHLHFKYSNKQGGYVDPKHLTLINQQGVLTPYKLPPSPFVEEKEIFQPIKHYQLKSN